MTSDMRAIWDRLSARYQQQKPAQVESADYGPWAPPESELGLLGDVRGRRVLDLGCGGGQSAIALARQGAIVTGLDFSHEQLELARRRSTEAAVPVDFVQGAAEVLAPLPDATFDLIFSANVLPYVADLARCLAACRRVLQPHGTLVFSLDHPFRDAFWDAAEDELSVFPIRSYFDAAPIEWCWRGHAQLKLRTHHLSIAQWIDLLIAAGFFLRRLVEPPPPQELLDELWPEDGALAPLRNLPHAIIFVAERV